MPSAGGVRRHGNSRPADGKGKQILEYSYALKEEKVWLTKNFLNHRGMSLLSYQGGRRQETHGR